VANFLIILEKSGAAESSTLPKKPNENKFFICQIDIVSLKGVSTIIL